MEAACRRLIFIRHSQNKLNNLQHLYNINVIIIIIIVILCFPHEPFKFLNNS